MKMLVNRISKNSALPFSLELVKAHLRVDGHDDDASIAFMALAAAREVEDFAQIALLTQTIRVNIFNPRQECSLNLPIGPVSDDDVPTVTIDGEAFTSFEFVGGKRPSIRWLASYYDLTPSRMTIEYKAGFGEALASIPHDIAQAVMDQTALYYDVRSPMDAKMLTRSPHMARIGARYRGVRI